MRVGSACNCQGFALKPYQRDVIALLYSAIGRRIRHNCRFGLRHKAQNSETNQEQQNVSYAFHSSKSGALILREAERVCFKL